jgi:6-phosphogluconolactonase
MGAGVIPNVIVGDRRASVEAIVSDVRAEHARATAECGRFSLAVPGGSVGTHAFPVLATLDLDWSCIDIFWVDERAVPPTDAESNFALADSLWLRPAGVPARSIHRMRADEPDLPAAAKAYGDELTRVLGSSRRLDYVLLGVGPDGHVASLFPGHPALNETDSTVVAIEDAPKPPPRRMTLTMPVLVSATRLLVAAFGDEKSRTLAQAFASEGASLPVAMALGQSARPLLVADEAAASRM